MTKRKGEAATRVWNNVSDGHAEQDLRDTVSIPHACKLPLI